jgi:hypothetical protein
VSDTTAAGTNLKHHVTTAICVNFNKIYYIWAYPTEIYFGLSQAKNNENCLLVFRKCQQ